LEEFSNFMRNIWKVGQCPNFVKSNAIFVNFEVGK
jgi:hypothetical protein